MGGGFILCVLFSFEALKRALRGTAMARCRPGVSRVSFSGRCPRDYVWSPSGWSNKEGWMALWRPRKPWALPEGFYVAARWAER